MSFFNFFNKKKDELKDDFDLGKKFLNESDPLSSNDLLNDPLSQELNNINDNQNIINQNKPINNPNNYNQGLNNNFNNNLNNNSNFNNINPLNPNNEPNPNQGILNNMNNNLNNNNFNQTVQQNPFEHELFQQDRDIELILAKLDAIKAELDSLHQRVRKIENIIEQKDKKYYW